MTRRSIPFWNQPPAATEFYRSGSWNASARTAAGERRWTSLLTSCEREGRLTLFRGGSLRSKRCKKAKDLTAEGQRQWRELLGLKRYLLDFSLLAERTVSETVLWQEYMVYAVLLGIAEQVLEQVRTLYPRQLSQVERYQRCLRGTNRYNHYLYAAVARQRQTAQAARSGGSGGFASLGGGGGFSGGGSVGTR